ncbi:MAG: bifunctional alpha/beta hydrolase/OsmC family protein [Calditrichia bacterium]
MNVNSIFFENKEGQKLSARLELPADRKPQNFALFAHCFTCNKNFSAIRNISRALTSKGFGVLRFDFTGLGESEGNFADTNFSGNIEDLIAAAEFLDKNHMAPALLVGHSLGGAAVIYAGSLLDSVRAVATIGAPGDPEHLKHLFTSLQDDFESSGFANVSIGGRIFKIKKQFIDDLEARDMSEVLKKSKNALLVAHSPQDNIVGIDHASKIFKAARHPKSFVSLDNADHLLSNREDSLYIGGVIAQWAQRYINIPDEKKPETELQVVASLPDSEKFTTQIKAGKHFLVADEPESIGGNNFGPSPYELVSSALAACTAMTIRMYADRKEWPIEEVNVHIKHSKIHADDCNTCESSNASKIDKFLRVIEIKGDLDASQRKRLMEIADKCPVHRSLHSEIQIESIIKE